MSTTSYPTSEVEHPIFDMNKVVIFIFLCVTGCVTQKPVALTPLEIQSIQQREFETSKEIAFASVVSVFQDLGYTINSADITSGFITAESAAKNNASSEFLFGYSEVNSTRATAFIETINSFVRVRLNFVSSRMTSSTYGMNSKNKTALLDSQLYQNAFEKIENAIFIRAAN